MRFIFSMLLVLLFLTSCSKRNSLADDLACSKFINLGETKTKSDFNKNFTVDLPLHWKKQGYFDDLQSSVQAADTIKQLSETYILDISYKYGEIEMDDSIIEQINKESNLTVLQSNFEPFIDLPSYWQISKGEKNGYTYHLFQQFSKSSNKGYLEISLEIYGGNLVDERLCEALAVINTIEFTK